MSLKCPDCPFLAGEKSELKKHTNSVHAKKNNCQFCGKSFVSPNTLKRHVAAVHEERKDFQCQICEKRFSRQGDLRRHVATVHEAVSYTHLRAHET